MQISKAAVRTLATALLAAAFGAGHAVIAPPAAEGLDGSILEGLAGEGLQKTYTNNSWIGRVGL